MDSKTERRMSKELENDLKSLQSLKDCQNMDDIDINKLDFIRGETPKDIKEKCLQLCKDYLSANWIKQTVDTIEVRRISGGLTNQLYYCAISERSDAEGVPQEVAVRLYGPKYFNNFDCEGNERLTDVVIALMVSKSNLGPKIYGLFEHGQIQAYYKHRQFKIDEQNDPKLVTEVFQKLARIHAMDVPIKKTHWVFIETDRFYESSDKNMSENELVKELNCITFINHDLKQEIDWIKDLIQKIKSPMVFTHNDFRSSNIMVLEDNNNNNNQNNTEDQRIVVCDFEYSSYGYRGQDFGNIINEWGRTWNDFKGLHIFPEDSTIKTLIEIYVKESERIIGRKYTENANNSVEQILKEVKAFCLFNTLFMVLFCLKKDESFSETFPMSPKLSMQFAETAYKNYWHLKTQFNENKVFD